MNPMVLTTNNSSHSNSHRNTCNPHPLTCAKLTNRDIARVHIQPVVTVATVDTAATPKSGTKCSAEHATFIFTTATRNASAGSIWQCHGLQLAS
eukprot:m.94185 g.94185  ORF g.94185 m.94185 type:complete len:94 (-) comp13018_c0_seq1:97-378(-)